MIYKYFNFGKSKLLFACLLFISFNLLPAQTVTSDRASIDFGTVNINNGADELFNLAFSHPTDPAFEFFITSVTFAGSDAAEFNEANNIAPFEPHPVGQPLEFHAGFSPTSAGNKSAIMQIHHNGLNSPLEIPLSGIGSIPLIPEITFNNINFGSHDFGETVTENLIIENEGNAPLTITALDIAGSSPSQFSIPTLTFPIIIPADGTADPIPVTYTSVVTTSSTTSARIDITSDDPDSPNSSLLQSTNLLPNLEVSTTSLAFGNVDADAPTTQTLTISNTGYGTLILSDLNIIAAFNYSFPEDYSITSSTTFPLEIDPNSSIDVTIEFDPEGIGFRYSRLSVETENAANTYVNISGTGVSPIFSAPPTITFPETRVGETGFVNLTITNNGNKNLTVYPGTLTGPDASLFTINTNLNRVVLVGYSVSIQLIYNPTDLNNHTAVLNYTSNDALNNSHSITINATSVDSDLQVSATNLNFSNTIINSTSANQTVTLSNSGGSDAVTVSNISISGTDSADFNLVGANLPLTIDAGSDSTFEVNFSPTDMGNKTAQIDIISNDSNSPQNITLSGTSLAPTLELSTSLLTFLDTEAVIQTRTKPFSIKNTGTTALTINAITISGLHASAFSYQGVSFPLTIPASESKIVEVVFSPQSGGMKGAMVNIESNLLGTIELPLLGTGNAPSLNASDIDFGDIIANRSETQILTLNNNGSSDLTITSATINGTDASLFSTQTMSYPITIASGGSTEIEIAFDPTGSTAGNKTANLTLSSNDVNSPSGILLTGNAVSLPEYTGDSYFELPETSSGDIEDIYYTVTNTGTEDLIITGTRNGNGSSTILILDADNNFPMVIPPGEQGDISIYFVPGGESQYSKTMFIETNDPSLEPFYTGDFLHVLSLTGGARAAGFYATDSEGEEITSANPLTFQDTSIGRSNTITVNITNTGNEPLEFFDDEDSGMFTIPNSSNQLGISIQPGDTETITLKFTPTGIEELKTGTILMTTNVPNDSGFSTEFSLPASGLAVEPADITVNGMVFISDSKVINGNIATLSGNVHTGNLEFSNDVEINISSGLLTCLDCEMYAKNIPQIGEFGGEKVMLQSGNIQSNVMAPASPGGFPELDFSGAGEISTRLFKLVGIPLEINKIIILADSADDEDLESDGIELGGKIILPAEIFGDGSEIDMETIRISTVTGVDIVGSVTINPELRILGIFDLNSASVNFDTINDSFGGSAEVGFQLMGKGVTVAAGMQIIRGGLDSVFLEVEVDPGIPIASTGFLLAGGNGFISGLVEPPISIGLGVDIVPSAPLDDVLYLDNMQLTYTFGTSFSAGGTIELFREPVGGGSVSVYANPNQQGVSLNVWANVYDIFKGNIDLLAENRIDSSGNNDFNIEMAAKLTVSIPEISADTCSPCQAINSQLPITIAEADVSMNNTSMQASVNFLDILDLDVKVKTNNSGTGTTVKFGANLTPINISFLRAAEQRNITGLVFENNPIILDRIENQSLIIDTSNPYAGLSRSSFTDVPFTLSQAYQNIIVRAEGTNATPNYTLVLPDGTELTDVNAGDFNAFHSVYDPENAAFFVLKNAPAGNYVIRLDDSDTYELDISGAEFAPNISNIAVSQNTSTNDITVNWNDEDLDSDAQVSFYYDVDDKGGDGFIIEKGISEDDATDQITWNANYLKNGTYYIYGKIDDGTNTPKILYSTDTFTIDNESLVPTTTLVADRFVDTIVLSWDEVSGADHYRVYIDEEEIKFNSFNQNVGLDTSFDFTEILPGRTYNFAVTVVFDDGTELTESNFSNIETINFISTTGNNIPKIETEELPAKLTPCDVYTTTIVTSDPDTTDTLTLTLLKYPEGMVLNGNTLEWSPNKDQKGKHEVILEVNDGNEGKDTKSFTITVFEVDDEKPVPTVENLPDVTAECSTTLTAPTANDNCSGMLTATTGTTTFDTQGTFVVTWTYNDLAGNTIEQIQNVTIQDVTAPNVQTNNVTVYLDSNGAVSITSNQIDNNSTDDCGIASKFLDITDFTCADLGANTVTLTVTDVNGLTNTNTATVTVADNENPTAIAQNITLELDANGNASLTADQVDNNSTDNCSIDTRAISKTDFSCADLGAQNVVLTVTDTNSNTATSTAIITVVDNLNPVANTNDITVALDANGNALVTANDIDNSSTDNCGISSRNLDISNFTCADIGANTVTLTVTDNSGNFNTKEAIVTVVDNLAPELTCIADFEVNANSSDEYEIENYLSQIIKTDNCSDASNISISQDISAGTMVSVGDTVVTITATDAYNNVTTCSFTITVNSTLGVNDVSIENSVILYPNPAINKITIKAENINISNVVIYDMLGKQVLRSTKKDIDVSILASGSYFAKITDDSGRTAIKKFMKK